LSKLHQILTDIHNYFTGVLSNISISYKFLYKLVWNRVVFSAVQKNVCKKMQDVLVYGAG